jgi:hypothetical protein
MMAGMIGVILTVTSCKKYDIDPDYDGYVSYLTGTYQNYSATETFYLVLTYNDVVLENKEVTFISKNNKTGKMTFTNIIKGENETTISDIDLVEILEEIEGYEGYLKYYTFEEVYKGKIKYSGSIRFGVLTLNLQDGN